jgi:hypothetical protein
MFLLAFLNVTLSIEFFSLDCVVCFLSCGSFLCVNPFPGFSVIFENIYFVDDQNITDHDTQQDENNKYNIWQDSLE